MIKTTRISRFKYVAEYWHFYLTSVLRINLNSELCKEFGYKLNVINKLQMLLIEMLFTYKY